MHRHVSPSRLSAAPGGVWANATTLYVSDADALATKVFAYKLADGRRDAAKDITLASENTAAQGLWSDGTTLWVADLFGHKLYAYTLATRSRDSAKDIALEETYPRALWSDGTTVWVVDSYSNVYAYTLAGSRHMGSDFSSGLIAANDVPRGLWSDGTTVWVADPEDVRLYAYTLASGSHDAAKYRVLDPANTAPRGVWSDGTTWYVADIDDRVVYVYVYVYRNQGPEAVGTLPNLTLAVGDGQIMEVAPAFRDPDGDTLEYDATTSMEEIALAWGVVNTEEVLVLGGAAGSTTVTVTSTDSKGSQQSATRQFALTVVEGPLPNQGPQAVGALPDLG